MQISLSLRSKFEELTLKKAVIYSILFIFLFNSMGYYFLFEMNRNIVRKEMQAAIREHSSKLKILTISDVPGSRDFHRINANEFMYKGYMYDVLHEVKTGNKTVFICLHDTKESKLLADFKRVHGNKRLLAIGDHFTMIYTTFPTIDLTSSFSGNLIFPCINSNLKSSILQIWSPPPEYSRSS